MHTTAEHDRYAVHVGPRIAVGVPVFTGDDRRLDRGAVDGAEGPGRGVAALQALQFDSPQFLLNDLRIGGAGFVAVVAAANEPIRADVRINVERERCIQGVSNRKRTRHDSGIAAQLAEHVDQDGDLALCIRLARSHVKGAALPCPLQLAHLVTPARFLPSGYGACFASLMRPVATNCAEIRITSVALVFTAVLPSRMSVS